jgi:serine/threonine protein kinase
MISGRPPFQAKGVNALIALAEQVPPPLQDQNPFCPADVSRLVDAMLHKDPAARPPTAESVARQLIELRLLLYPEYSAAAEVYEKARITQTGRFSVLPSLSQSSRPRPSESEQPAEAPRSPSGWGAAVIRDEEESPVAPTSR